MARQGAGGMGLRELKETAHAQYLRGKFEQCAQTYRQILRLAPKDPNLRVRHAEACRRAGDRQQAISSYRTAADLLLAIGCESRARGALKAALELDPRDPVLLSDLARLGHSTPPLPTALEDERLYGSLPAPGVLEPWEPSASVPPRSGTRAGLSAPVPARSGTCAGLSAPVPARSGTATVPAPAPSRRALPSRPLMPPPPPAECLEAPHAPGPVKDPAWASRGVHAPPPGPRGSPAPLPGGSTAAPPPAPHSEQPVRLQVEVRRLAPNALAFRLSPRSRWVLFTSRAAIQVRRVDSLEALPEELRDFTLDITVEEPDPDSLH